MASWIPRRKKEANKGDFGHVLIVAGSKGMSGAAILAARGALRAGVGLVTVGTAASQQPIVAGAVPEALTLALPETKAGSVSSDAEDALKDYAKERRVNALVLGPGLSTQSSTVELVHELVRSWRGPLVLDADGLNAFAGQAERLARQSGSLVVTPHPGEFERLWGSKISSAPKDRADAARRMAQRIRGVCVLKGNGTVVTDGKQTFVNTTGNPFMAQGGMGDVLSGFLGGLAAQGIELFRAACLAVHVHGLAGDLAVRSIPHGLTAGDLTNFLPQAMGKVLKKSRG